MNGPFKVGEICIGQNFINYPEFNKMECEIIDGLDIRTRCVLPFMTMETGPCYKVRWENGEVLYHHPSALRRKPPKQDLTEWANAKIAQLTKPVEQLVKECA